MLSVIFDMDGTLLDTQRIYIPAWDYVGEKLYGIKNMGSHMSNVCGMNRAGCDKYLRDNFEGINTDEFRRCVGEYVHKDLKVTFKDGAEELLDFLEQNGIKFAIASGTSRESINHHLKEVGAENRFNAIVGGMDVQNGKPAPDVFLLAAEKMGVPSKDCIVFEDSPNGIKGAHSAGMKCIGVRDVAKVGEDEKKLLIAEIDSLAEGIEILKKYL